MTARGRASGLVLGSQRERATIVITAALAGAYAAFMLLGSRILGASAGPHEGAVAFFLGIVSSVFIAIALYVSAIVIAGSVATVIAGRLKHIATLRLLGADARGLRQRVMREVAVSTALGGTLGALVGTMVTDVGRLVLENEHVLPHHAYPVATLLVVPALAITTVVAGLAGYVGAQRVLTLSPAAALAGTVVQRTSQVARRRVVWGCLCGATGGLLLALACWLGERGSAAGLMTAFFGGAVFVLGLIIGAPLFVPECVAVLGRLLGSGPSAVIARRNAVADPMRTARATLGLIIGTGLVTTFASGSAALSAAISTWRMSSAERRRALDVLHMTSVVMTGLVVVASIIAAVGFVSTMSLVVLQRRREIGMLRAMGFTAAQVRGMVTRESLALGLTAVVLGMGLGIVFGSVGAQALIGVATRGFVWGVPAPVLTIITLAALLLVLLAALPPARRATKLTPVCALRVT